ncbi:MAG: winged helix-turn-helix domain-containing protein [Nanoarchaeota archaeon]|nr:winged helix-turn-helix domain-containing protein [Nanoarchaeota archaeon]
MVRKRTRIDIIGDMLKSIMDKGGCIKPTHLMYKSNLSHQQMKGYLEELVEKKFIRIRRASNEAIIITDKGRSFVNKLGEIKEFEKAFGL